MRSEILYHGTDGDRILSIMESGVLRPNDDGQIFFGKHDWTRVLMYGVDRRRGVSFAVQVSATVPDGAVVRYLSTPGVRSTVVIVTAKPVPVRILELYVRKLGDPHPVRIVGPAAIRHYLQAR